MQPDFLNNTGQNNLSRSFPSPLAQAAFSPEHSGSVSGPQNEHAAVGARGLGRGPPAPAAASPGLEHAQGTARLCCCEEASHSVVLLCNQGFEVIFRHSRLGSRAIECSWPVVGQQQLPGEAWLQHPSAPSAPRAGPARSPPRARGHPNSLIIALESWIAAAPGQESQLCHLLVR